MENHMKKEIDPCNNFYEYACGNYIAKYLPDPYTESVVLKDNFGTLQADNIMQAKAAMDGMATTQDPVFKKAHSYYSTCMNTAGRSIDTFWKAAASVGGSKLTTRSFSLDKWNSDDALLKLKREYNVNPLFSLEVGTDLLNSSRNIFLVSNPTSSYVPDSSVF